MGRNGADDDQARHGQASRRREKMEAMHNEDPKKWSSETKPKWDAAPEV